MERRRTRFLKEFRQLLERELDMVVVEEGRSLLDDNAVECPRHGGRFDLFTGRVLALPPVRPVNAYETVADGDEVQVRLP